MKTAVFLVLLLAGSAAQAQMYKCVDAKGVTRYSDKPMPDCKREEKVDIKGQPPISGKVKPRKEDFSQQEREFQGRQIRKRHQEETEAKQAADQRRRCAALRSQLELLARGSSISKVNEKGERVFIDDAQREARATQLRAELSKLQCPG